MLPPSHRTGYQRSEVALITCAEPPSEGKYPAMDEAGTRYLSLKTLTMLVVSTVTCGAIAW